MAERSPAIMRTGSLPQSEKTQNRKNNNNQSDDVDNIVHPCLPTNVVCRLNEGKTGFSGFRCFKYRCCCQYAQTWKLSPQPQRPFSFGLMKVNPDVRFFTW